MSIDLISARLRNISPQVINSNLNFIIARIAENCPNSEEAKLVYNILCSTNSLIIRYETVCRELILASEVETDSEKLRERIYNLCNAALRKDIVVPQLVIVNE